MSEHLSARCSTERASGRLHVSKSKYLAQMNKCRDEARRLRTELDAKTRSKVSALRMSDMKNIKTKLVTFVTDSVRLSVLLETKIFLRAVLLQEEPPCFFKKNRRTIEV